MSETIKAAVAGLRSEEASLARDAANIEATLTEVKTALKQIQAALAALGEEPATRRKTKKKRSASAKDVAELIAEHLRSGPQDLNELRQLVAANIANSGRSRTGLHKALERALQDERFAVSNGKVGLRRIAQS